jgi:uncharacterized membrane protein (Fun14 family)
MRQPALAVILLLAGAPVLAEGPEPVGPEPPVPPQSAGTLFDEAFFLTVGFSFFVGLAAGYVLKVALKLALLVLGVLLLGTFILQYNHLVDVNWSGVEAHYDQGASWLQAQGGALLDFMGGHLASGASFVAGLALGLRL